LLPRGWVWGVHTRWGFTHCHLEQSTKAPPPPLRQRRNEPRRHLRQRVADLAAAIRGISNLHAVGDLVPAANLVPAATSPSAPHLERTVASPHLESGVRRDVPSANAPRSPRRRWSSPRRFHHQRRQHLQCPRALMDGRAPHACTPRPTAPSSFRICC
jgi:hypothetical protein